jgi:hypothetical protein
MLNQERGKSDKLNQSLLAAQTEATLGKDHALKQ